MKIKKAIEILERHNKWRRGAETEMEHPKELGIAIEAVIEFSKRAIDRIKQGLFIEP